MLNIKFGPIKMPPGMLSRRGFAQILVDEIELGLIGASDIILAQLRSATAEFTGTAKDAWKAGIPVIDSFGTIASIECINDDIAAGVQEYGANFGSQPPIDGRKDERDIIDWVESRLHSSIDSIGGKTYAKKLRRLAFGVARKIHQRGLPSSRNAARIGKFAQVEKDSKKDIEEVLVSAVRRAISRWAEVDLAYE